jgi:hypothetical protein
MFENGFRDYEGLAQWVRGQGYEISEDSLWRYGYKLKQQFVETKWTILQLRALAELGMDQQDLDQALMRVAQTKALATLAAMEEIEAVDLNARTNLLKTVMTQQQRAAEFRARCRQQQAAGTTGPASAAPAIGHDAPAPPAAPAVPQSQGISVSVPAKPKQVDSSAMAEPNGAAEPQPRNMAVPAAGDPPGAPSGTAPAPIANTSHHALPRNDAEPDDAPAPTASFINAAAEQGPPAKLQSPNIPRAAKPNSIATLDSAAAAVKIQATAHPRGLAQSQGPLARSLETATALATCTPSHGLPAPLPRAQLYAVNRTSCGESQIR